jgi:hypothetical protein
MLPQVRRCLLPVSRVPQPFILLPAASRCGARPRTLLLRAGGALYGGSDASAQGLLDNVPAVSIDPGKWKYVAITLTAPGEPPKVRKGAAEHQTLDTQGQSRLFGSCAAQSARPRGYGTGSGWCVVWRRCRFTETCTRRP